MQAGSVGRAYSTSPDATLRLQSFLPPLLFFWTTALKSHLFTVLKDNINLFPNSKCNYARKITENYKCECMKLCPNNRRNTWSSSGTDITIIKSNGQLIGYAYHILHPLEGWKRSENRGKALENSKLKRTTSYQSLT